MPRLARSLRELRPTYDAVIVGSGYGGGVAAARLARTGLSVAVIERGREILPGEFPSDVLAAQRETQLAGPRLRSGAPTALFDVRMGEDVHVLVGCGLGGTSLINANVCLSPDQLVLEDPVWPLQIRADHYLNLGFSRARRMLAPAPLPSRSTPLKLKALEAAARSMNRQVGRVPLHVAFEDRVTPQGVVQRACTECGDCMGGCNVGAKTTVHSTYLTEAANYGAELFCEAEARRIERGSDGFWRVVIRRHDGSDRLVPTRVVTAPVVILSAGTLGTTEILMRSSEHGLRLSGQLGKRFSTNADAIAFGYDNDRAVNAVGTGSKTIRDPKDRVGPAVSGLIDLRRRRDEPMRLAIVEAAVQSALAPLLPLLMGASTALGGDKDRDLSDRLQSLGRNAQSLARGAYKGAVRNTQVFLAIGHDSSGGELHLVDDRIRVSWPHALAEPVYAAIEATLKEAVGATGGTYVANPATTKLLGGNLFTVHPLGGCAMAEDRIGGVVDHKCRVFDGDPAKPEAAVHEGLYVCDGSVLPRSVGIHPLLTITAIAERSMLLAIRDFGLEGQETPPREPPRRDFAQAATTGRAARGV
jgi:cholesterol oxidase